MMTTSRGLRLEALGISVRYGRQWILRDLSLSVLPGECVGLLGGSGCGKSTLLRVLARLQKPAEGRVVLTGPDPEAVGFVPQDDLVHPALRVESSLRYAARLRLGEGFDRRAQEARVEQVLGLLGLEERRRVRVGRLSGGQRKRVSIGVELLADPPLLFLDEPTSGLDPALEEHFMELFRSLADRGQTVVLTTHILQSLHRLDLVGVLGGGGLAYFGPPSELLGFFGVSEARAIYALLGQGAEGLAERYRASDVGRRFLLDRLEGPS